MSGWERGLFLRALLLLPVAAVGLRLLGLRRFQALLMRRLLLRAAGQADMERAQRVALTINRAACNGLYRANCLQRSFVLWWLLRRRGIDTQLRIGVRKRGARFEAHAWLEYDGIVLNDDADISTRYAAFAGDVLELNFQ